MANAIYTPDPDPALLVDTKAARIDKQNGASVIGYCIDTKGKTTSLRVLQAFPDDPMIDDILMQTISEWRFKPFMRDGRPIKTCTYRKFNLVFKQ